MIQRSTQSQTALQRLAPWVGIASAALLVVALVLIGDTPDSTDRQQWLDFYENSDNTWMQVIGAYLGIVAAFLFLWFGFALVQRVAPDRAPGDVLTGLARAAAIIFATLLILAMLVQASISAATEIGDTAQPETADFGIQFEQLAFGILLVAGAMAFAVFIATTSELAREERFWPQWLTWAGFAAAVLLLLGALFFPIVLIPLWMLTVAIVLLTQSTPNTRSSDRADATAAE